MGNALTNGATITVVKTGASYHTLDDWGLAIGNNDYIDDPEIDTNYVFIPGRSDFIDLSEVVSGKPVYTKRKIHMEMGGVRERLQWDNDISSIRNKIHGQLVQIVFDNDPNYYWQGRCEVVKFDRFRELGEFEINIETASPFKWAVADSQDSWLWDPFDFEDGIIPGFASVDVDDETLYIPVGDLPINPVITVNSLTSATLTISWDTKHKTITHTGSYRFPEMWLYDNAAVTFTGQANITITYRSASL